MNSIKLTHTYKFRKQLFTVVIKYSNIAAVTCYETAVVLNTAKICTYGLEI